MQHILQLWTAPKCQTDAEPVAPLPVTVSGTIIEAFAAPEAGSFDIDAALAQSSGVAEGQVLRAFLPLRTTPIEYVVTSVSDSGGPLATVTLGPLRRLLGLRGRIRETITGATLLTFTPGWLTPKEFCARYVFTNLAEDGLEWLSPGTFVSTAKIKVPTFTAWTRDQALVAVEKATGNRFVLRALAGDAGYALDEVEAPGIDRDPVLLECPGKAVQLGRIRDLEQTATVVLPMGGDDLPMGEVEWTGGAATGSGPYWIPLADPDGGPNPIRENGQFVGRVLGLSSGSSLPILDSRSSDSAVQVAALGTYVAGDPVCLWEDAGGRPLATIESPSALASSRGRVVAVARVPAARNPRNLLRNSGFASGMNRWTEVNGTGNVTAIARSDLDKTLSFLANGARAAATGTGTPFTVDGLPTSPPEKLYIGDQIVISGATLDVNADAVPSTSGALTLSVAAPGLPAAYVDNDPFTLVRREVRALEIDGAQAFSVSGSAQFRDVNTDAIRIAAGVPGAYLTDSLTAPTWMLTSAVYPSGTLSVQYVTGTAGKVLVSWGAVWIGTPPASWTDGQTVLLVFPRETRTLLLNGAHSAAATSISFRAVAAIARRDFLNGDDLSIDRSLTGTAAITGVVDNGDRTFTVSIGTGSSTLDEVLAADRDNIAELMLPGTFGYFVGGAAISSSVLPVIVGGISGSTMTVYLPDWIDSLTTAAFGTGTVTANWSLPWTGTVTAGAAFGNNAQATLSVTVPSGVTLARGAAVACTGHPGGCLVVKIAVTGPAASIVVEGGDQYGNTWMPGDTPPVSCYRVFANDSTLPIPGETLVVGANATANGSGQASVTLRAANVNLVPDNSALSIVRRALLTDDDRPTGSVLRSMYAPGTATPTMLTPGAQSSTEFVSVLSGPKPLTAKTWWVVTAGALNPTGSAPIVALVNLTANTVLAVASIDAATTYNTTTAIPLTITTTLRASALLALRVYGGSSTDFSRWHILKEALLIVGDDEDIVWFDGAGSRQGHHRGQDVLEVRAPGARYTVTAIDQAMLEGLGTPLEKGQRVQLRAPARGIDVIQRIERLQWAWPGPHLMTLECGALQPRLFDTDVSL